MEGFIMLPVIRWDKQTRTWSEPKQVRMAISEILNYSAWRLSEDQKDRTKFAVSKVMVRRIERPEEVLEEGKRKDRDGLLIVAIDERELDVYLGPANPTNTYRP